MLEFGVGGKEGELEPGSTKMGCTSWYVHPSRLRAAAGAATSPGHPNTGYLPGEPACVLRPCEHCGPKGGSGGAGQKS